MNACMHVQTVALWPPAEYGAISHRHFAFWLFYDLPYPQPPPQPNCAGASLAEGGSPSVEGALGPENGR